MSTFTWTKITLHRSYLLQMTIQRKEGGMGDGAQLWKNNKLSET